MTPKTVIALMAAAIFTLSGYDEEDSVRSAMEIFERANGTWVEPEEVKLPFRFPWSAAIAALIVGSALVYLVTKYR